MLSLNNSAMVHKIEYFISQQFKHSVIAQLKQASKGDFAAP